MKKHSPIPRSQIQESKDDWRRPFLAAERFIGRIFILMMNLLGVVVLIGFLMQLMGVQFPPLPISLSVWFVVPLVLLTVFSDYWHWWIAPKWFPGASWFEDKDERNTRKQEPNRKLKRKLT